MQICVGFHWGIHKICGYNYSSTWFLIDIRYFYLRIPLPYALLFFKLYNSSTVLTHFLMAAQHTPAQGEGKEGERESTKWRNGTNRRRQEEKWYCNWQSLSGINHMHKFNLRRTQTFWSATPTRSRCCSPCSFPAHSFLSLSTPHSRPFSESLVQVIVASQLENFSLTNWTFYGSGRRSQVAQ